MKKVILVIVLVIILSACAPKPEKLLPFVEQTLTAIPTNTSYPTYTPQATYTPEATYTAVVITKVVTATQTLTPSPTFTVTFTPTPIQSPTPTPPPTSTFTSWQFTSTAVRATNDYLSEFTAPDRRDFLTYPEKLMFQKIKMQCRIFNVVDNYDIQCYIPGTYDAFYASMNVRFDNLYEKDNITIYGIGKGQKCFTNRMGNNTCQPLIGDAFFTKP